MDLSKGMQIPSNLFAQARQPCLQHASVKQKCPPAGGCVVCRDIADCAAEFKSRKLPLHGLINNVGVENPDDTKSKEGFDVSNSCTCHGHQCHVHRFAGLASRIMQVHM